MDILRRNRTEHGNCGASKMQGMGQRKRWLLKRFDFAKKDMVLQIDCADLRLERRWSFPGLDAVVKTKN